MANEDSEGPRLAERARSVIWAIPLVFALAEVLAHATMASRVPSEQDWQQASAFIRARLRPRDQVLVAPSWADPLLREHLGETLGIERAGSLDLESWNRVWVVSLRGRRPDSLARRVPADHRRFGELAVQRYDLGRSPVLFDFVAHWTEAEATLVEQGGDRLCPRSVAAPRGGGLGQGDYWPTDRMSCDPQRPWIWFAPTINEDLDLALRYCLFQHPAGPEPFRVTYRDVPLGERLVVDADIYYENERSEMHGFVPFELRVLIDGRDVGTLRHMDGQGRKRMVIETQSPSANPWTRADVTFETTTVDPHFRGICWSGSTRTAPRPEVSP